jgi:hypothetical protein
MLATQSAKFAFRIRVRSGAIVDRLTISGNDASAAERKLRQIYHGCVIIEVRELDSQSLHGGAFTYEEVVDLISSAQADTAFASAPPTSP